MGKLENEIDEVIDEIIDNYDEDNKEKNDIWLHLYISDFIEYKFPKLNRKQKDYIYDQAFKEYFKII